MTTANSKTVHMSTRIRAPGEWSRLRMKESMERPKPTDMKYNRYRGTRTSFPMPNRRRVAFTGFGAFLLGILAFVLFFYASFRTVEVHGPSMETTYKSGRRLLMSNAYWLVGEVKKNDIVVVKSPDNDEVLIKRVKGLPGDVIDFMDVPRDWRLGNGEYKVPAGKVYVLGDNRPVSQDSRDFGPLDRADVMGKVVMSGQEPWLFGILTVAVLTIGASGIAALVDSRKNPRREE